MIDRAFKIADQFAVKLAAFQICKWRDEVLRSL